MADEVKIAQVGNVTTLSLAETNAIESRILTIRGQQVMLDRDLAFLYGVETRALNQAVKRNIERFPEDFMFQLTKDESARLQFVTANIDDESSRSQFVTLNDASRSRVAAVKTGRGTNLKYLPYAFTENGVAMLSSVLRSKTAIEVNIRIMRAFTTMRRFLSANAQVFQRLETIEYHQLEMKQRQDATDKRIDEVFRRLDEGAEPPRQGIFYDGQVFDAYAFACDLVKRAKQEIVLIDNYIDETVLTLLDKRDAGVAATVYTAKIDPQLQLDINRHNSQYAPIAVNTFNKSHDRFLCIDSEVFHIGASLKDLGKRWFAFSKMEDLTKSEIISRINGQQTAL